MSPFGVTQYHAVEKDHKAYSGIGFLCCNENVWCVKPVRMPTLFIYKWGWCSSCWKPHSFSSISSTDCQKTGHHLHTPGRRSLLTWQRSDHGDAGISWCRMHILQYLMFLVRTPSQVPLLWCWGSGEPFGPKLPLTVIVSQEDKAFWVAWSSHGIGGTKALALQLGPLTATGALQFKYWLWQLANQELLKGSTLISVIFQIPYWDLIYLAQVYRCGQKFTYTDIQVRPVLGFQCSLWTVKHLKEFGAQVFKINK